jgi:hypothetical protein
MPTKKPAAKKVVAKKAAAKPQPASKVAAAPQPAATTKGVRKRPTGDLLKS